MPDYREPFSIDEYESRNTNPFESHAEESSAVEKGEK
jgi:hypothetical protein